MYSLPTPDAGAAPTFRGYLATVESAATRLLQTLRDAEQVVHRAAIIRLQAAYDDVCRDLSMEEEGAEEADRASVRQGRS